MNVEGENGVPWDRKSLREGARAYRKGKTIQANPYPNETWAKKSWAAGWADEAQGDLVAPALPDPEKKELGR